MNRRKLIMLLATLLVAGGLIAFAINLVTSESSGTITAGSTSKDEEPATKNVTVTDKYASFTYTDDFSREKTDDAKLPVLMRYNFTKSQVNAWELAITVNRLEGGSLDDDGTYHFRAVTPERFSKIERKVGSHDAVIFLDTTAPTFAKVAYLHNGNTDVSIALTGGTSVDFSSMQSTLDAVVASWQWR